MNAHALATNQIGSSSSGGVSAGVQIAQLRQELERYKAQNEALKNTNEELK